MVNTFLAYGNYENRGKARTRYMQEKLGSEGYVKAFLEKLEEVKKNEKLDLNLAVSGTEKAADGELQTENKRIVAQKQPGLYAVKYHPIGGAYCGCLRTSRIRSPCANFSLVSASSSEPNCAKDASSRNCASSTRIGAAIFFIALI